MHTHGRNRCWTIYCVMVTLSHASSHWFSQTSPFCRERSILSITCLGEVLDFNLNSELILVWLYSLCFPSVYTFYDMLQIIYVHMSFINMHRYICIYWEICVCISNILSATYCKTQLNATSSWIWGIQCRICCSPQDPLALVGCWHILVLKSELPNEWKAGMISVYPVYPLHYGWVSGETFHVEECC